MGDGGEAADSVIPEAGDMHDITVMQNQPLGHVDAVDLGAGDAAHRRGIARDERQPGRQRPELNRLPEPVLDRQPEGIAPEQLVRHGRFHELEPRDLGVWVVGPRHVDGRALDLAALALPHAERHLGHGARQQVDAPPDGGRPQRGELGEVDPRVRADLASYQRPGLRRVQRDAGVLERTPGLPRRRRAACQKHGITRPG